MGFRAIRKTAFHRNVFVRRPANPLHSSYFDDTCVCVYVGPRSILALKVGTQNSGCRN